MIIPHHGKWPKIHETAFVAPSADIIGEVEVGSQSSIWFQCILRGDVHWIKIGNRTNIQDHSTLHVTRQKSPLSIGNEVTIGHRVMLHGCKIGNRVLVGMGCIILDNAEIGDECLIGAGSLVTQGVVIPPRSLVLGAPAKVVRELKPSELDWLPQSAQNYVNDSREYQVYLRGPVKLGNNDADLEDLMGEELDEDTP